MPADERRRLRRAMAMAGVALLVTVGSLAAPAAAPSGADPGDVGWEGPSYQGAPGSPSGSKPQSKVWFNDGLWWATLYSESAGDFHIWRLDIANQTWVDTGTLVDTRPSSRSDALWTGQHLYIANHVFTESGNAAGDPAQLRRYSYSAATKTYTLDTGFPVNINQVRSETLVIDRESTGRLWATWVQGGQVKVTHTTTDDRTWATPFDLPVDGTDAATDDISAVIAYRSDRIGIMWSNQDEENMSFAYHLNSSAPGTWSAREIAYSGGNSSDDHINLATVQDVGGRILAAVKTSRTGSGVLNHLLDRNPTTGEWTSHTYGLGTDSHTRPIVVVDSQNQQAHMFATGSQSGGSIHEKTAPLSNIVFPPGKGEAVLTDASNPDINNATSTKQNVTNATGLVVVASNDSTREYWTHYDPLGGSPPGPVAPTPSFTRTPASGAAPLSVGFTDTSTGSPTSWSWSFGDGGTSTAQNPTHQYTSPGTYTVSLTAANAGGPNTVTQVGSVVVSPADPPPGGTSTTFTAIADGYVKSTSPTKAYGTETSLQVRAPDPEYQSFVRFDVGTLANAPTSAKLRLWVTDASPVGGTATRVGTGWTESSLTFNARPAAIGGPLGSAGATTAGQWVTYDVTSAVTGPGPVAFRVTSSSTNSGIVTSREGPAAQRPQLVVTTSATPSAPQASFTRTPTSGTAPLAVGFTDTSTGIPTSWSWSFGDGGTSTVRNPGHTYAAPGSYTVSLTVTNALGTDTTTQVGSVVVSAPPPPGSTVTYTPTADGQVQSGSPTRSYGTDTSLQVRAPTPAYESYLQFSVAGLSGAPSSAKLRLWVTDASPAGGAVTRVQPGWTEASLTYNSRPAPIGGAVASVGASTAGTWIEIDVTAAVTGNGTVALGLTTSSTNSAVYSSRETGARAPQLVVTA